MKLLDLFEEIDKKQAKLKDRIKNEYFRVKGLLGKSPSRIELFTYMEDDVYQLAIKHSKDNPFKKYLEYREELGELPQEEKNIYQGIGREFINLIENTSMTKVYKMPVLMAFVRKDKVLMEVTEQQLLESWKEFFRTGTNWKIWKRTSLLKNIKICQTRSILKKSLKCRFIFTGIRQRLFCKKDGVALALRDEMIDIVTNPIFVKEVKDAINYRALDYYQRRYRKQEESM